MIGISSNSIPVIESRWLVQTGTYGICELPPGASVVNEFLFQ